MTHNLLWQNKAWDDYLYWQQNDKQILKKINELLKAIDREPFQGIGKPEPLKHSLEGYWSRRITQEHRIVYKISGKEIIVAACRYHY
jgi:toxin YoeB